MNPTAAASAYRDLAAKISAESSKWPQGDHRTRLRAFARDLSRAARMQSFKPDVDDVVLDAARELWMKSQAVRGVSLLAKMLEARDSA